MQTEIEVKFLDVNHDDVRKKLKALGATLEQPMRLMRRAMFDFEDNRMQKDTGNKPRLRVRDEGNKVTITYKIKNETNYVHEVETTVGSFDDMIQILEQTGLVVFSFQESKRETWDYKNVEVVLDEWPWLNPYIEIEGPTEAEIKAIAAELGFRWEDGVFGSVDRAYRTQYPGMKKRESIGEVPKVIFNTPLPKYLVDRQKS